MKRLIIIFATLVIASSAFAQERSKTLVIKDGKLLSGPGMVELGELLAGKRAYLGVSLTDLSSELREHFGAPKDSGVLVASIEDGSPAEKAGLRVGDIIVSVEGKDVTSAWDLRSALKEKKDGESARIDILRGRNRQTVVATLVEREFPGRIRVGSFGDFERFGEVFKSPEWRARVESLQDCGELQTKLKELEARLKDLEKKLK